MFHIAVTTHYNHRLRCCDISWSKRTTGLGLFISLGFLLGCLFHLCQVFAWCISKLFSHLTKLPQTWSQLMDAPSSFSHHSEGILPCSLLQSLKTCQRNLSKVIRLQNANIDILKVPNEIPEGVFLHRDPILLLK